MSKITMHARTKWHERIVEFKSVVQFVVNGHTNSNKSPENVQSTKTING